VGSNPTLTTNRDVAELVYATDLKSVGLRPCGFESHHPDFVIKFLIKRNERKMLGRYKPRLEQIVDSEELGFAGERQANTELTYQTEFGGHKDLVVVEYDDRFYVCFGGEHKSAYKTFLTPSEIKARQSVE